MSWVELSPKVLSAQRGKTKIRSLGPESSRIGRSSEEEVLFHVRDARRARNSLKVSHFVATKKNTLSPEHARYNGTQVAEEQQQTLLYFCRGVSIECTGPG